MSHLASGLHRPPTSGELRLYGAMRAMFVGLCRLWFRVEVINADKIPAQGPFILAPVHRSNLDFALVLVCSKRRMRYLAKDFLWKGGGLFARLFTALGGIPVARGSADREALKTCIEVLEAGEPLVMFPEGTRQHGPVIEKIFEGPAFVQSRTGVPIVPVGIGGSEAAMPRGARMIKPHKVVVIVGDPLEAIDAEGPKARREAVHTQSAELHEVLQGYFDEAQRLVGSPNS